MIQFLEKSSYKGKRMRFFRRKDLKAIDRAVIGLSAIVGAGIYGTITDIASNYNISRPFVYELKSKILSSVSETETLDDKQETINFVNKIILVMKLCCRASVGSISEALKNLDLPNNSIGYVSELLNDKASFCINDLPVLLKPITVLADEIFICNMPVLVILDASSHLILCIELGKDRTGKTWHNCFQSLTSKGYVIKKVAKDLGTGLFKGANESELISQADLFHLQKPFDTLLGSLTSQAARAIEAEELALNVLNNRKSEAAELKAMEKYFNIMDKTAAVIDAYDSYDFLHRELHIAFNTFEHNGTFRDKDKVNGDAMAAVDLMEEFFGNYDTTRKAISFLRNNIDGYFPFTYEVESILKFYHIYLPDFIIQNICLAYQKDLKAIAVKDYSLGKQIKKEAGEHLAVALAATLNEDEKIYAEELAKALSKCIRSSSALEAKNSVIRRYADSSTNNITQKHLNLIAFYMNRKVAIRGKYKGASPIGRFTGIEEELSFLEQLMQK